MPTIVVLGQFDSLAGLDGEFIILDQPSDSPGAGGGEVMPGPPVAWNPASPVGDVDWSFFTVAADGAGQIRYSGRGATLVSPSYAVCADHAHGSGGFHFLQPNGVEISRTSTMTQGVDYWNIVGDLGLIKLNTPITTIDPIPILLDCSVAAGKPCVAIEMDRHLNRMVVSSSLDNSDSQATVNRTSGAADAIEGGDSGKPVVCLVNGTPVLVMTAITSGGASSAIGHNASHHIADIQAILDADDEELTLWDVTLGGSAVGRTELSSSISPCLSPTSNTHVLYQEF